MENKQAKKTLCILYGNRCLLTNIHSKKQLSFHHIDKKEWGGKATAERGANLIMLIHQWLHNEVEKNNIELYYLINECLLLYKQCLDENRTELIQMYEEQIMPKYYEKYLAYRDRKMKHGVHNK